MKAKSDVRTKFISMYFEYSIAIEHKESIKASYECEGNVDEKD